jgi:hypothetical protein
LSPVLREPFWCLSTVHALREVLLEEGGTARGMFRSIRHQQAMFVSCPSI